MCEKNSVFLFKPDASDYSDVTINWKDNPLEEFAIYAGAYHRAGEKLMTDLLSEPSFHDIDPCPIVFLYRHSIELYLKEICLLGHKFFQLRNKRLLLHGNDLEQKRLFNNHKLLPLVEVVKQIFEELGWSWDLEDEFAHFKEYKDFETVLGEIDDLDSGSYTFRYPYDKHAGTASLTKGFSFNLASFQKKINIVISALDGISTKLGIDLESALESAYLQQQE